MTDVSVEMSIGYCGYLCTACPGGGCPGCKTGGGDADCPQKACCTGKGLQGCWDCGEFPCTKGSYGTEEGRGLSVGCAMSVKCLGAALYADRVVARIGKPMDFDRFRNKPADEVADLLCGPDA